MDSQPNTLHRSSLLIPGLLLILLFLTSLNFAAFLKQQCHWTQKLPFLSKMITCPSAYDAAMTFEVQGDEECLSLNVEAFRAYEYESHEALGEVMPGLKLSLNRSLTIRREAQAEHPTQRLTITRGTSVRELTLQRSVDPYCNTSDVEVHVLRSR